MFANFTPLNRVHIEKEGTERERVQGGQRRTVTVRIGIVHAVAVNNRTARRTTRKIDTAVRVGSLRMIHGLYLPIAVVCGKTHFTIERGNTTQFGPIWFVEWYVEH